MGRKRSGVMIFSEILELLFIRLHLTLVTEDLEDKN